MWAKSHEDIYKINGSLDAIKRLSDRIIGIGPINIIGLDGILAWVPGVGPFYSIAAGLYMVFLGLRARVDLITLVMAAIAVIIDSGISAFDGIIPVIPAGSIADTLFQGHLYAAHLIQSDIKKTLYIEDSFRSAKAAGRHLDNIAQLKATKGKSRLVYLY